MAMAPSLGPENAGRSVPQRLEPRRIVCADAALGGAMLVPMLRGARSTRNGRASLSLPEAALTLAKRGAIALFDQ